MIRTLVLTTFFVSAFLIPSYAQERGMFIWSWGKESVLCSREGITRAVDFAHQHGIKTIFVHVYRSNKSWFPSVLADQSPYQQCLSKVKEDPLALMIKQAHVKGVEIHAWMNLLSLSGNKQAPLLKKYGPDILTRNKEAKLQLEDYKVDNQYFLEPSDRRVRKELLGLLDELISRYPDLDGVQFDYIRYPDVRPFYGYSPDNVARFKKTFKLQDFAEEDLRWKQWKRDQVTALLEVLVKKARKLNPELQVSTTGSLSYTRAYHEALQDWPAWLNSGLVDFVTVMNYPDNFDEFKKNIDGIKDKVKDPVRLNIAVGAYKFTDRPALFKEQFDYCRQVVSRSCVIFHYDNFIDHPALSEML